jgi:hypothetical protein
MQDRAGPELSDDVTSVHNNPYASLSIQQQRSRLPIFKVRRARCTARNRALSAQKQRALLTRAVSNMCNCRRDWLRQVHASAAVFARDWLVGCGPTSVRYTTASRCCCHGAFIRPIVMLTFCFTVSKSCSGGTHVHPWSRCRLLCTF